MQVLFIKIIKILLFLSIELFTELWYNILVNFDFLSDKENLMHEFVKGASLPSVASLSFLGDAVHSLYVRRMLIERGICKSGELNSASLEYVTAERQAEMARRILPHLLEDEQMTYKRAFNSSHLNKPKHAHISDYRAATGFEAVLGMLYFISDNERLDFILRLAHGEEERTQENDTED
jgi:ribonuclease-3 family protein